MPFNIIKNGKGAGTASFHATSTQTLTMAEMQNDGETLTSANIVGVYWSGTWNVTRGGVTLLALSGSGFFDLVACPITINNTSDIIATLTGNGTIILKLNKLAKMTNTSYAG